MDATGDGIVHLPVAARSKGQPVHSVRLESITYIVIILCVHIHLYHDAW